MSVAWFIRHIKHGGTLGICQWHGSVAWFIRHIKHGGTQGICQWHGLLDI